MFNDRSQSNGSVSFPQKVGRSQSGTVAPFTSNIHSERESTICLAESKKGFLSSFGPNGGQLINKSTQIALQLQICLEHIAFVECSNKVWSVFDLVTVA